MISIQQFLETIDYHITGGSEYGWQCFGTNARWLDCERSDFSASIVFDSYTQEVYSAEISDYKNNRAYRLMNPDYAGVYRLEAKQRNADDCAWDTTKWTDLEDDNDWLEKAQAIITGEDYDARVVVPLDLPDDVMFDLMKKAHEEDITLNQLVEKIMKDAIDRHLLETQE